MQILSGWWPEKMMFNLFRAFKRLAKQDCGIAAVEFGIAAPVILLLFVGISDLSRGYSERIGLQQAANRTLELAHLGTTTGNYNFLVAEAASAAGVPQSSVTLESWLECNGTRSANYTDACGDGQQIARYITLTIRSRYTPTFGMRFMGAGADGTVPLTATASLRVQ
jgi:Flp pilus assembly protein TadG